jgi:hypothetical protein
MPTEASWNVTRQASVSSTHLFYDTNHQTTLLREATIASWDALPSDDPANRVAARRNLAS